MNIIKMLIRHEGLRLKPYKDSVGKLTIGVGRNLDDKGITKEEAIHLLLNDIYDTMSDLDRTLPWWRGLDEVRKAILINMCFNLGLPRLMTFRKMLKALEDRNYELAAKEMLDSKWAKQVGNRAIELSEMMRTGKELV